MIISQRHFTGSSLGLLVTCLCISLAASNLTRRTSSGYDWVDPLIGTLNGGHVFPGATLPFGMAKAVADVNGEAQGGFASDGSQITGFSHMHDSGTGGSLSLGNFPLFPQVCASDDIDQCKWNKKDRAVDRVNGTVEARPGYFAITLNTTIRGEMTVTNHTALYRFTFPDTASSTNSPVILLDLTDLSDSRSVGNVSVSAESGRILAQGVFAPSFGIGTYTIYACADFSGAQVKDTGIFVNNRAGNITKSYSVVQDGGNVAPEILPAGAYVQFETPSSDNQILARVGMSFISTEKACSNAETEIADFGFDAIEQVAKSAWEEKLSVVDIDATGVNDSLQTVFWSGVYRAMISPQDYTGENPLWESEEPYYDSYYCIWDSFRSIHQLITILDPHSQTLMVRSLIDIYRHEGKLPDCRMSLCKGNTQGGSNADIVLTDSYLKNITEGVDWLTAYEAMISDAEVEPPNWQVEGRGGLESWKSLHYVPADDRDFNGSGLFTRSISRTVEYAYDDWCIAQVAKEMAHMDEHEKYLERSGYWKNVYNPDQTSFINGTDTGFTGFLQPRYLNHTFGYQDPIFCSPLLNFTSCYLNPDGGETYEGSAWLYTFFVPGDMASLITTFGGPDQFVKRLDYFHESGLNYLGDEQAFLTVYQYHYAGRPGRSSYRAHSYIPSLFNDTVVGIPGNDDSGAMGSFVAFAMMGIFPNAGQNVYLITPPFFPSVSVRNGQSGKTATIRNVNFDPTYTDIYIQSATLNGEPYTKSWIDHSFFLDGGLLELTLGPQESSWGRDADALPPSLSAEETSYQGSFSQSQNDVRQPLPPPPQRSLAEYLHGE